MKKFFAILLALVCLLAMTACGETAPEETLPPEQMPGSSLEILEKIWAGIPEDKRQPVFGGDSSNVLENVPGAYDLADDGAVYIAKDKTVGMLEQDDAFHILRGEDGSPVSETILGQMYAVFPERSMMNLSV